MELKIFTIRDEKAEAYLPPFFLPQSGMALRTFTDCVNSKDHQFGAHPHDYTIFEIGVFNDRNAGIEIYNAPKPLGNGVEFLKPQKEASGDLFDATPTIGNDTPILGGASSGNSA